MSTHTGVTFVDDSSSATGRAILAGALDVVDPVEARAVRDETAWRREYLGHFKRAVEAGIGRPDAARRIAADGLAATHENARIDGTPLLEAVGSAPLRQALSSRTIVGRAAPETELSIPYRGERLRGAALVGQLGRWVETGIVTQSCADAVVSVIEHPEWLRLEGDTVVVLGAGAEMGPYRSLLRWGADIVALDLPRADVQERITDLATTGAGRTVLPARILTDSESDNGADLLHELPAIADWLGRLDGRLVLGSYCYADGATHVRLSMAGDALATHLLARRPDTALAYLATPTDVFVVPEEEVAFANAAYRRRSLLRTPVKVVSGGRLLQRNYPPHDGIGVCDALVPQQGPNYTLAKRIQRWRATTARAAGTTVSLNVAPSTRTRSVVKNRALAMAYAGAHRFGMEVFDPATSNALMAALLVHDLRAGRPAADEPWQDEAHAAAHGGLWTAAYHPRSALGLAAVLGVGALRG